MYLRVSVLLDSIVSWSSSSKWSEWITSLLSLCSVSSTDTEHLIYPLLGVYFCLHPSPPSHSERPWVCDITMMRDLNVYLRVGFPPPRSIDPHFWEYLNWFLVRGSSTLSMQGIVGTGPGPPAVDLASFLPRCTPHLLRDASAQPEPHLCPNPLCQCPYLLWSWPRLPAPAWPLS